jgi:hypothetical protein
MQGKVFVLIYLTKKSLEKLLDPPIEGNFPIAYNSSCFTEESKNNCSSYIINILA